MTDRLKEYVIRYHCIKEYHLFKKGYVKKKKMENIKNEIISSLEYEITFVELYKILKDVQKEGFGFYIKLLKCQRPVPYKDVKEVFQKIYLEVRKPGFSYSVDVFDKGFGVRVEDLSKNKKDNRNIVIKPEEIERVSNIYILNRIKYIGKDVYEYIIKKIIDTLYEKIEFDFKREVLSKIATTVIKNSGKFSDDQYSFNGYKENAYCLEEYKGNWMVYIAQNNEKYHKEIYNCSWYAFIEIFRRLIDGYEENYLEKNFYLELLNV